LNWKKANMRPKTNSVVATVAFYALVAFGIYSAARTAANRIPVVHAQVGSPAIQQNILVTVATAGTPVRVTTSTLVVSSVMVQPVVGASVGLIYICTGIQSGTTPASYCAATANGSYELGAQLSAATATVPGFVYSFYVPPPGLNLSTFWIDAATSGAQALVSFFIHQ
jgi:hypothetical protein